MLTGDTILDPFGGNNSEGPTKTVGNRHSPSPRDIKNSGVGVRYVFAKGEGKVYIYNNQGVRATLPIDQFVKPK